MDKETLRERIWDALEASGEARFPFPPHGRIPNFAGASEAADRLADTAVWRRAETIKANPDAPQLPVRRRALHGGKTVYMAVPRLGDERPFMELDPERIPEDELDSAPTVSSGAEYARKVAPDEMPAVDLVVSGGVAVTEDGARVGKGEGYSDIEYALLRELDLLDESTPVVTTVHERQVVDDNVLVEAHDVPMDLVVTPDRVVKTNTPYTKPEGIEEAVLTEDQLAEIPILGGR